MDLVVRAAEPSRPRARFRRPSASTAAGSSRSNLAGLPSPATASWSSATTSCCCRDSSIRTSTSTIPAAPVGRLRAATRAAAAGGVTTIVDMPLNSLPPTVDVAALEVKRKAATGRVHVDVGFWGGAIPGNVGDLRALHEPGCSASSASCCTRASTNPRSTRPGSTSVARAEFLRRADDRPRGRRARDRLAPEPHGGRYVDFLSSRPREAENLAISQVIEAARRHDARAPHLDLPSAEALPLVASARRDGVALTAETFPHYLSFIAEEIRDGATPLRCCPPCGRPPTASCCGRGSPTA